jgi:hypothetical protein
MALGLSLRGARPEWGPEEPDRVIRELGRLDPWSFWVARVRDGDAGDLAVVGTTGAFLISICGLEGYLAEERGRLAIGDRPLTGIREIRRAARSAEHRLGASAVFTEVEPIVCLTRAVAGRSRTTRGVRVVRLEDLVGEITSRPRTVRAERAERGAAVLGDVIHKANGVRAEDDDQ